MAGEREEGGDRGRKERLRRWVLSCGGGEGLPTCPADLSPCERVPGRWRAYTLTSHKSKLRQGLACQSWSSRCTGSAASRVSKTETPGRRQRDAAPFNDWERGGHRNGLETEVLRSGPESAPPHGILHRNGMAPMVGQEVTETGSLSHAHKKPPHSSHHLLAAGLLLLPFSSKNCPHLQSARPYLLLTAPPLPGWGGPRGRTWVRMEQGMLFGEKEVSLLLLLELRWSSVCDVKVKGAT